MPVFVRRAEHPEPQSHYWKYRALVREDFSECCAYCLLHELLAAGEPNFQLDHFRPKSLPQFAHLVNDFFNLYYSCSVCNRYKSNSWPSLDREAQGYGYVDLCKHDFLAHFREEPEGIWRPLTRQAEYTLEKLRLNRPDLVKIRMALRRLAVLKGDVPCDWSVPSRERILRFLGSG